MKRLAPKMKKVEELYLFGEITDERTYFIVTDIDRARIARKSVRLWICSLGGDLGGAMAIHDALRRTPGSEAIATGNCQSAALVAFLGAERRYATPNTIFHNHEIVGEGGEKLPVELESSAIFELRKYPQGSFGPKTASEFGLVLTVKERP